MSKLNHTDTPAAAEYATVHVAFELSKATWHLGLILPGSQKLSRFGIDGGDLVALSRHIATWRAKAAATGKPVQVISCYEAGYDGHWLHRWLTDQGVINHEIDPIRLRPPRATVDLNARRINLVIDHALTGQPPVQPMTVVTGLIAGDDSHRLAGSPRLGSPCHKVPA